jgi:hypothetical protein
MDRLIVHVSLTDLIGLGILAVILVVAAVWFGVELVRDWRAGRRR